MPDYKRLVSYIYNYENGVKRNNVGYARVEARNGQCKYTIHISAPSLNERLLKVYMFKRRDGRLEGILLGNLLIRNGIGELKGQTESGNLMNSSYSLDDIGGILLYLSDAKFFASEWDDQPITMDAVAGMVGDGKGQEEGLKEEKEQEKNRETEQPHSPVEKGEPGSEWIDPSRDEERDRWEDSQTEKYYGTKPESGSKPSSDSKLDSDSNTNSDFPEMPDTWEEPEENELKNIHRSMELSEDENIANIPIEDSHETNNEEVDNEDSAHIYSEDNPTEYDGFSDEEPVEQEEIQNWPGMQNQAEIQSRPEIQNQTGMQSQSEMQSPSNIQNQTDMHLDAAGMKEVVNYQYSDYMKGFHYNNNCEYGKDYRRSEMEDHPIAKRLYSEFPRMFPFEDNEIAWCVRIEPQDIGILPMEAWILGNNSFLLHGYYSYRHLIFARMNHKNGHSYIIGIPGIYHNREKFMAKMFGFENFKCVKNRERKTGEFGYWYVPVLLS